MARRWSKVPSHDPQPRSRERLRPFHRRTRRQAVRERDLENQLIDKLRDFILELGYGFCFIGRQHRLTLGRNEYFIDLPFYRRFLKSLVAIELKIGKFEPEYAGKMDFYLNLLNDRERGGSCPPRASCRKSSEPPSGPDERLTGRRGRADSIATQATRASSFLKHALKHALTF